MGVNNLLWGKVKHGDTTVAHHEDVLRFGARFTVEEAVEKITTTHPDLGLDNKRMSTRLSDAKAVVAKAHEVSRAVVKKQFDEAQTHFGVKKRKDRLAASRRRRGGVSSGLAATMLPSGLTEHEEGMKLNSDDGEAAVAAGVLVGLSGNAWAKFIGVKECEEVTAGEKCPRQREDA